MSCSVIKKYVFVHPEQAFGRAIEDERLQKEESDERAAKLRTSAIMVLKEKEHWKKQVLMLLEENKVLQKKLSICEEKNGHLKGDLQQATEEIGQRGQNISSQHQLSVLQTYHEGAMVAWLDKERQHDKAEEEVKRRDEKTVSLHQTLHCQKQEMDRMRASFSDLKESRGLKSSDKGCSSQVSQLKELLAQKDQEISRAHQKRIAHAKAHVDTLVLLNITQASLEESKQKCDSLEEKFCKFVTETAERYQKELSEEVSRLKKKVTERQERMKQQLCEKEESYRKELSDSDMKARKKLAELSENWEAKVLQWEKDKRELEERMLQREQCWNHEEAERKEQIQCLVEENVQLQVRCLGSSVLRMSFRSFQTYESEIKMCCLSLFSS